MDPTATIRDILDAIRDGDADSLEQAAEDLADWLRAGGFLPDLELEVRPAGREAE